MSGEHNLHTLLKTMTPELVEGEFVFCCVQPEELKRSDVEPLCRFQEREGITLILSKDQAEQLRLPYTYVSRMITLAVHSSLEAVGFLARITTKLAAHGISVNAVSAYYHDHLFVPTDRAHEAMQLLSELTHTTA